MLSFGYNLSSFVNQFEFDREDAMANMKDIAKIARVSLGTVSHVLNNSANVRSPLRKRVLEAVQAAEARRQRQLFFGVRYGHHAAQNCRFEKMLQRDPQTSRNRHKIEFFIPLERILLVYLDCCN